MQLFLILHNIRSLHNVGSMFRTADGAGVEKIYLTGYTPSPYDFFGKLRADFSKTALGAEKFVAWEQRKNIASLLAELKRNKIFIFALEQHPKSVPYHKTAIIYDSSLRKKKGIALIVGNEVRGLSSAILKKSDAVMEIPMHGKKESLNVSVAAGIALYSLREQLGNPPDGRAGRTSQ